MEVAGFPALKDRAKVIPPTRRMAADRRGTYSVGAPSVNQRLTALRPTEPVEMSKLEMVPSGTKQRRRSRRRSSWVGPGESGDSPHGRRRSRGRAHAGYFRTSYATSTGVATTRPDQAGLTYCGLNDCNSA